MSTTRIPTMQSRAQINVTLPVKGAGRSFWMDDFDNAEEKTTPKQPNPKDPEKKPSPLPPSTDILVIGSGISGAAVVYELLFGEGNKNGSGEKIVMLEARGMCEGATGRNGGHTKAASYRTYRHHAQAYGPETAVQIARFEYENIQTVHAISKKHDISCDAWLGSTVDIFFDDAEVREAKRGVRELRRGFAEVEREREVQDGEGGAGNGKGRERAREEEQKEGGVQWYEFFSAAEAREEFQITRGRRDVVGAVRYVGGSVSGYKFVRGVLDLCLREGGGRFEIFERREVVGVEREREKCGEGGGDGGGDDKRKEAKTKYYSVHTADGSMIRAKHVVLATNAYTGFLRQEFQGVIVPLRGQVTAQRYVSGDGNVEAGREDGKSEGKKDTEAVRNRTYSFIYPGGFDYLVPYPTGSNPNHDQPTDDSKHGNKKPKDSGAEKGQTYILGGGLTLSPHSGVLEFGETDDRALNPAISTYLHRCLQDVFGGAWRVEKEWTGVMGYSGDGSPFVGRVDGDDDLNPGGDTDKKEGNQGPRIQEGKGEGNSHPRKSHKNDSGLWITASFQGHGMVLCWGCAREVVRGIRGVEEQKGKRNFPEVYRMRKERLKTEFVGFVG